MGVLLFWGDRLDHDAFAGLQDLRGPTAVERDPMKKIVTAPFPAAGRGRP